MPRGMGGKTAPMALVVAILLILVLIVLGGAIVGLTLTLLGYVVTGLVIGALARLVLPGRVPISLLATVLYGIAGALAGGILADALGLGAVLEFVVAVGVAAALIAVFAGSSRRPALR